MVIDVRGLKIGGWYDTMRDVGVDRASSTTAGVRLWRSMVSMPARLNHNLDQLTQSSGGRGLHSPGHVEPLIDGSSTCVQKEENAAQT